MWARKCLKKHFSGSYLTLCPIIKLEFQKWPHSLSSFALHSGPSKQKLSPIIWSACEIIRLGNFRTNSFIKKGSSRYFWAREKISIYRWESLMLEIWNFYWGWTLTRLKTFSLSNWAENWCAMNNAENLCKLFIKQKFQITK